MKRKPNLPPDGAELRRCAEVRLAAADAGLNPARTAADNQRLLHELQVHQIELEMQQQELVEVRDRLECELEKYSDLYDFAPVCYLTLDREGTIREANMGATRLLGIDRSSLITRRFARCVLTEDRRTFENFLTRIFESKSRESCEISLLKQDGSSVTVRIEAAIVASGQECRTVITDVTARNQAEQDRLILGKLESTGILAGGIAHDFNNLLTVILLDIDRVQTILHPEQGCAHLLGEAKKAALSARSLTRQLITFSTGGAPSCKPCRLPSLIGEASRPPLSGSRVRCEISLKDDLWAANVDAGQFEQVISNLVLNAREAMTDGGLVSIKGTNVVLKDHEVSGLSAGDHVRISVHDRGGGIAREVISKIFDPYFSTKKRGTHKGMGLGLTICRSIIQKHGGTMTVSSDLAAGTTFEVYLPAFHGPLLEETPRAAVSTKTRARILIMDDEETLRKVLGKLCQGLGHEVEVVPDGNQAVALYTESRRLGWPFALVLLDLTVRAGVGGLEAMKELLVIDPGIKALAMSGYSNDPVMLRPQLYGFKGVLAKPFDIEKLQEAIMQHIATDLALPPIA